MSLKIEIVVPFDERDPAAFVAKMLAAIGYTPLAGATPAVGGEARPITLPRGPSRLTDVDDRGDDAPEVVEPVKEPEAPKADDKPVRERGKPSPGGQVVRPF